MTTMVHLFVCNECGETLRDSDMAIYGEDSCGRGYKRLELPLNVVSALTHGMHRASRRMCEDDERKELEAREGVKLFRTVVTRTRTLTVEAPVYVVATDAEDAVRRMRVFHKESDIECSIDYGIESMRLSEVGTSMKYEVAEQADLVRVRPDNTMVKETGLCVMEGWDYTLDDFEEQFREPTFEERKTIQHKGWV